MFSRSYMWRSLFSGNVLSLCFAETKAMWSLSPCPRRYSDDRSKSQDVDRSVRLISDCSLIFRDTSTSRVSVMCLRFRFILRTESLILLISGDQRLGHGGLLGQYSQSGRGLNRVVAHTRLCRRSHGGCAWWWSRRRPARRGCAHPRQLLRIEHGAPVLVGHVLAVGDAEFAVRRHHARPVDPLRPPADVRGPILHCPDGPSLTLPLAHRRAMC